MLRMDQYYGHSVCRFTLKDSLLYLETGKLCDMLSASSPEGCEVPVLAQSSENLHGEYQCVKLWSEGLVQSK